MNKEEAIRDYLSSLSSPVEREDLRKLFTTFLNEVDVTSGDFRIQAPLLQNRFILKKLLMEASQSILKNYSSVRSIQDTIPSLQINPSKEIHFYSRPAVSGYLPYSRSIPHCKIIVHDLLKNTNINTKSLPIRSLSNSVTYIGRKIISPLKDSTELSTYMNNYIRPLPLVEEKLSNMYSFIYENQRKYELFKIKEPNLKALIGSIPTHFSEGYNTPLSFGGNKKFAKALAESCNPGTHLEAIEILKRISTFKVVTITIEEYLKRPHKYIIHVDLPKIATYEICYNGHSYAYSMAVIVPTVIIPEKLLTPIAENTINLTKNFIQALVDRSLDTLLHKELYEQIKTEYPGIVRHWNGLLSLIGLSNKENIDYVISSAPTIEALPETIEANSIITNLMKAKTFPLLSQIAADKKSKQKSYNKTDSNIRSLYSTQEHLNRDITDYKERILDLQDRVEINALQIDSLVIRQTAASKEILALQQEIDSLTKRLDSELETLEPVNTNYDLVIDRLYLNNRTSNSTAEVTLGNIKNTLTQLASKDWNLVGIRAYTTSPIKIYVDNADKPKDQCDVVVGGPYIVSIQVQDNKIQGIVQLNSTDSIFGKRAISANYYELKQHPHSSPMQYTKGNNAELQRFFSSYTTMCFGQTELPLIKAFRENKIEVIRSIVWSWLTNAWSKDQWGSQWAWFPGLDQVQL